MGVHETAGEALCCLGAMNLPRLIPVHWTELEKVILKMGLQFARQKPITQWIFPFVRNEMQDQINHKKGAHMDPPLSIPDRRQRALTIYDENPIILTIGVALCL